ncbi:MAG: UDP-glucose/GDP-mannose dehydrogenase family protein [Paludibacteraceae bacterium]|nr:UDP-glucose/GDP-mannose dehydrogenase family protein [Paludibacteraceae bacterium]
MKIAIVGTGYVGLVSGACFADLGINVTCIDTNQEKINNLKKGIIPIYEPNLDSLVIRNLKANRLIFSTELTEVLNNVEAVFIAVGTPSNENNAADLKYVFEVAKTIGQHLTTPIVIVTKSTVPVGTSQKIKKIIEKELKKRNVNIEFDIASNPEFLKEGNAIADFMKPDRVVVGIESEKAKNFMTRLYTPMLLNNFRVIFMDIASAEMTKYAANAMLATRISFMNDIANLCECVGADVNMVRKGIGSDKRIGGNFLYSGCGYGGSCFPKDIRALIQIGEENNYEMKVIKAVDEVNNEQKLVLFKKLKKHFGTSLKNKKIAIWGLSFKPETDDMRESPALVLIEKLLQEGCKITVYDPIAMNECKARIGDVVDYAKDLYESVDDANAILHVTEWKEFRMPNWDIVKKLMKPNPTLFDGRNVFNEKELKGIKYFKIG